MLKTGNCQNHFTKEKLKMIKIDRIVKIDCIFLNLGECFVTLSDRNHTLKNLSKIRNYCLLFRKISQLLKWTAFLVKLKYVNFWALNHPYKFLGISNSHFPLSPTRLITILVPLTVNIWNIFRYREWIVFAFINLLSYFKGRKSCQKKISQELIVGIETSQLLWLFLLTAICFPTWQTQRRCHNVATTSEDWSYRCCHFVGNKRFSEVS